VREAAKVRTESDFDMVRKLVDGDIRSYTFERRDMNTSDDSSVLPQHFMMSLGELVTVGPHSVKHPDPADTASGRT
jgi:hypothetical protein